MHVYCSAIQVDVDFQPGVQWSDSEWQSSGYASSAQALSQEGDPQVLFLCVHCYNTLLLSHIHFPQRSGNISMAGTAPGASSQDRTDRIAAHVKFLASGI